MIADQSYILNDMLIHLIVLEVCIIFESVRKNRSYCLFKKCQFLVFSILWLADG